MAVNGRSTGITRSDLDEMGDRFVVPSASEIVDRVLEVTREWSGCAEIAGVPADVAARIGADIETWSAPLR